MKTTKASLLVLWPALLAAIAGAYLAATLLFDGGRIVEAAGAGLFVFGALLLCLSPSHASSRPSNPETSFGWWTRSIGLTTLGTFLLVIAAIDASDRLVTHHIVSASRLPFARRRPSVSLINTTSAVDRQFEKALQRKYAPAVGVAIAIPGSLLALAITVGVFALVLIILSHDGYAPVLRRGRRVLTLSQARAAAASQRGKNDRGFRMGGVDLPEAVASLHGLVCGSAGAAKTTLIKAQLAHILRTIEPGSGKRVAILDTKLEMLGFLHGLRLKIPIYVLNPRDVRGVFWNMSADFASPMMHAQFANTLVPEDRASNNRFFGDASRALIAGVLTVVSKCLPQWTFRDLLLAAGTLADLRMFLESLPETSRLLELLGDEGTARNVMASLASFLRKYDPIAGGWHEAPNGLSLENWLKSESVLVLGFDERAAAPVSTIYRTFLQRMAELLLSQPESRDVHTYLFLDEIRHANFPALRSLMTNSRSKGTSICSLGFQDLEGMHDAFGEKIANEIIGQCSTLALLRTSSVKTANWASEVIGDAEWFEWQPTDGPQGTSWAKQINKRRLVLPAEFMSLPMAGPENGIPGWFASSAIGCWQGPVPWNDVVADLPSGLGLIPEFIPRSSESEHLKPWTAEERSRIIDALRRHKRRP